MTILSNLAAGNPAITLTKARALQIQAEQIAHYVGYYGEAIREIVANATQADMLEDRVEYDVVTVNRYIPRGGKIEWLCRDLKPVR